jgi:hypothetical protein
MMLKTSRKKAGKSRRPNLTGKSLLEGRNYGSKAQETKFDGAREREPENRTGSICHNEDANTLNNTACRHGKGSGLPHEPNTATGQRKPLPPCYRSIISSWALKP